ncbi:methionyl-tRNA formyltransferase, mitochondrial [Discoglossus pictus]
MGLCSPAWRGLLRGEHVCAAGVAATAWRGHQMRGLRVDEGGRGERASIGSKQHQQDDRMIIEGDTHGTAGYDITRTPTCTCCVDSNSQGVTTPVIQKGCKIKWGRNETNYCTYTQTLPPITRTCGSLHGYPGEKLSTQGISIRRKHVNSGEHFTYVMFTAMKSNRPEAGEPFLTKKLQARRHLCCAVRFYSQVYPGLNKEDQFDHSGKTSPPWNVMFFGTDEFALESLKILNHFSSGTQEPVVRRLEVVTLPSSLPKGLPVKNYAVEHGIPVHEWPDTGQCDQFHVGVVASFGRLLNESLILKFPYGILNVHPSCLPRWRGPAPIIHTILNGDETTGVTIMQIRPKRFDVGPIVMQEMFHVPPQCTSKELEALLSKHGAEMLISVMKKLPQSLAHSTEQPKNGVTFAPKLTNVMSCVRWEEQSAKQIIQLERAIGYFMPLQAVWMGSPIKLLGFTEAPDSLTISDLAWVPGSVRYDRTSKILVVRCKDGWVGIRAVIYKKKLSATDFYNGYMHPWFMQKSNIQQEACRFHTLHLQPKTKVSKPKQITLLNTGQ